MTLSRVFLATAVLVFAQCAQAAVQLEGTFGFTPIGSITYSGADLAQATSVSLPSTEVVNVVPAIYNGNPNDFFAGSTAIPLLSQIAVNPATFALPPTAGGFSTVSYPDFLVLSSGTTPADRYDFTLLQVMKTSSGTSDLELYGLGILHDSQGLFADTPGQISIAFTQAGPGGVVNASFSVATAVVPEPGTALAGCFALGFMALGGILWTRQ